MLNIMKSDTYRLLHSKGFYIFWLLIILTYGISVIGQQPGGISFGSAIVEVQGGQKMDILQAGYNFTWCYLFIMLVFMIVVADFSTHAIKNTLASSINRLQYYLSKFILAELAMFFSLTVSSMIFYGVNRLVNGEDYSSAFGDFMKVTFEQMPMLLAAGAVMVFLAFLLRSGAVFNAIVIVVPMLYTTFCLVVYENGGEKIAEKLLKYELNTACGNIAMQTDKSYITDCAWLGLGAILISLIAGYVVFKRTEIK